MASNAWRKCLWELQSNYTVATVPLFFKVYAILYYEMTQSLLWNDPVLSTLDIVVMFTRTNGMHLVM